MCGCHVEYMDGCTRASHMYTHHLAAIVRAAITSSGRSDRCSPAPPICHIYMCGTQNACFHGFSIF